MKNVKFSMTFIFSVAVLLLGFQNCSPSQLQFEDLESTKTLQDFSYTYSAMPSHYLESVLILNPAPNPGKTFKIRVFIGTPSSSSNTGTLRLTVKDENQKLLCPQDALDLSTGVKDWSVDCVPPSAFSAATVVLSVTGSDSDFSVQKSYSLD